MSSGLIKWSGLAAMPGGVLGIILTPILSYLWATFSDTYGYFGRLYFLVFLGCMAGLAGLYAQRRGNSGLRGTEELHMERLVLGMTFFGLAIALVGSILDYWGGGSGEGFTQVQRTGFGIRTVAVLSGGAFDEEELRGAGAADVYEDCVALLETDFSE